ncbi:MAG: cytochrome c [Planctomycetota bacterium]|nr:cytochrome c [Planctomycetota bacterium]
MKAKHLKRTDIVIAITLFATLISSSSVWPANGESTDQWKAPARANRMKNPIPRDGQSISIGKNVYGNECLSCHGNGGCGDGPAAHDLARRPTDLSRPSMWDQTDGAIFWKITNGRSEMPCFEKDLPEEQRWHVTNFLRTLAPTPTTQPGDNTASNGGG